MKSLVKENHKKISAGRSTQQLLKDLMDKGFKISKSWLLEKTNDLKLKERGLVGVHKIWTASGTQNTNIYSKESVHEILMIVKKIYPEEKKQYLIESTKPKIPTLAEIKQIGLALAGMSEAVENQQIQIEDLRTQQNMCRVSAEKDQELLGYQEEIVRARLHKKGLSWNDPSVRQKEYGYLRGYLKRDIGIPRVANLNANEWKIVRDKLLEIMNWERIPY